MSCLALLLPLWKTYLSASSSMGGALLKRLILFLLFCLFMVWPDDVDPSYTTIAVKPGMKPLLCDQQSSEAWLKGFEPMYGGRFAALRGANGHVHNW